MTRPPNTHTVMTDDEAYALHYEYDHDGIYPIRYEHNGFAVLDVAESVKDRLHDAAYAYERDRRHGIDQD